LGVRGRAEETGGVLGVEIRTRKEGVIVFGEATVVVMVMIVDNVIVCV
jgi:hypothetical protein